MGYTHYWSHDEYLNRLNLTVALEDCRKIAEAVRERGVTLRGGMGEGEPRITDEEIWLNGDGSQDLDHESFYFPLRGEDALDSRKLHGCLWAFCKTARKPYDLAVCAMLLVLKHYLGSQIRISSDGGREEDEWLPAERLVEETLGYQVAYVREETL